MLIKIALLMTLGFGLSSSIFAVELRDASSEQILNELATRLQSGGGRNSARASYFCTNSDYLKISVVGPTGAEVSESLFIGTEADCLNQTETLNAKRSQISSVTVIGVCNNSAYLKRFSITTAGALTELSSEFIGDMRQCLSQADVINRASLVTKFPSH